MEADNEQNYTNSNMNHMQRLKGTDATFHLNQQVTRFFRLEQVWLWTLFRNCDTIGFGIHLLESICITKPL